MSATITGFPLGTIAATGGAESEATRRERYLAPGALADALGCLARDGAAVTILAGGTDLMPQIQTRRKSIGNTLMNIRRIAELQSIALDDNVLRIGALATITAIMRDPLVARYFPVIVQACDHFASDQIRNVATIGGNVSNASPAGDLLPPLIALDAEVELARSAANDAGITRRTIPIADYFLAPGRTRREPEELVTGICVSLPRSGQHARFFKFGTRPALDISAISIAYAAVSRGGRLAQVRIAFGAVAPTPVRARATEKALEGKRLDASSIAQAAATARDEVTPIDDVRASAWYRKEMIHNMTRRLLEDVAQA